MKNMKQMIGLLAVAGGMLVAGSARAIPEFSKDAFQGVDACRIVDTYNEPVNGHGLGLRPSIEEAKRMLVPCLEAISRKYAVNIGAGIGIVDGQQAIFIEVSGAMYMGNSVLMDLRDAIQSRGGMLLTHPVQVEYLGVVRPLSGNSAQ